MSDSEHSDLQKRARWRLLGGAVVALIAAIVLPLIMDDEPVVPTHEIQVTIPDRDSDIAARPIAGVQPQQLAPAPLEQPLGGEEIIDDEGVVLDETPPSAVAAAPALRPVESPRPTPPAAAAVTPPPPPPVTPPKPAIDEAARVAAILEGRELPAAPVAAASPSGKFVVQVGAFGDAAKAGSLSADLKKRGFPAFTESAGPVTRVRVGPFANRNEAERVVERLRELNMSPVLTKL